MGYYRESKGGKIWVNDPVGERWSPEMSDLDEAFSRTFDAFEKTLGKRGSGTDVIGRFLTAIAAGMFPLDFIKFDDIDESWRAFSGAIHTVSYGYLQDDGAMLRKIIDAENQLELMACVKKLVRAMQRMKEKHN